MKPKWFALLPALTLILDFGFPAVASADNAPGFPLRVHVFQTRWQKNPGGKVEGEGRADLFENGQPRGFDYTFHCSELFRASTDWETYPARWRKRNGELEILIPVTGKPGTSSECTLRVVMKNGAYEKRNGQLTERPASEFKAWMVKHNYDPEHGKNHPAGLGREP